ncbi:hypothetical protein M378DRAFT_380924 [Amanita muscaria Koide BX008]|uniref:Uncharacterized protein n=1 Tax=Amanita muscaria (strain Koide BX008) TaxID=946122 RepID=A0A0C2S4H0_AMAMK|nr:hypothetical protein M378DRAFT_380924 [Amanita muscaria Koide BX008]
MLGDPLTEGKQQRSPRRTFSSGNDPNAVDGYPGPPQDPRDVLWLIDRRTTPDDTHGNNTGPSSSHQTYCMGHEPLT